MIEIDESWNVVDRHFSKKSAHCTYQKYPSVPFKNGGNKQMWQILMNVAQDSLTNLPLIKSVHYNHGT